MSHQPERKETNCLNCGTTVIGRYCHVCGQENVETRESFWSLTKHFVFDILHFDGKFWHTLKFLIKRPGFVARQYCEGKRSSYLHPIRMYLFTSAIFFFLFFATKTNGLQIKESSLNRKDRAQAVADVKKELVRRPGDSTAMRQLAVLNDTTEEVYQSQLDTARGFKFNMGDSRKYKSVDQYDSVQKSLPEKERDGWLTRKFTKRGLEISNKYKSDMRQGINLLLSDFLHKIPYMLFLSLPFFALILKLLYIRRKNFFYSDHVVFTLYHYIFSFILLMVTIAVQWLQDRIGIAALDWILLLLVFVWIGYLLIEMKFFYRQSWVKTILKFLLVDLLGFFLMLLLFIAFLLFSVFEL